MRMMWKEPWESGTKWLAGKRRNGNLESDYHQTFFPVLLMPPIWAQAQITMPSPLLACSVAGQSIITDIIRKHSHSKPG